MQTFLKYFLIFLVLHVARDILLLNGFYTKNILKLINKFVSYVYFFLSFSISRLFDEPDFIA